MTKDAYERLRTAEGEAELCDLIIAVLAVVRQKSTHRIADHWQMKALEHAIAYVEDWKNSL